MPKIEKKPEAKKLERKYFTDAEMKAFDKILSPFLVDGKLTNEGLYSFYGAVRIAKVEKKTSPASKNVYYDVRVFENKLDEYFIIQRKISQWPYWKSGGKGEAFIQEEIAEKKEETLF